ncbi:MAG: 4Fe-4S dicluster domain-containing protein [Candidatus Omnitrophica bacterium]|nr:4Fe-4S dicluster domain-containing protein [Candidatus Omnitrophota bacterium]
MVTKIPRPVQAIIRRLIHYYPLVNHKNCTGCETCVKICPQKAMSKKDGRIVINYYLCISCFCCQETCPCAAIDIKKNWFTKMIGL